MEDLDQDGLRMVIEEAQQRIKKQRWPALYWFLNIKKNEFVLTVGEVRGYVAFEGGTIMAAGTHSSDRHDHGTPRTSSSSSSHSGMFYFEWH